jgi:hypothetical protein
MSEQGWRLPQETFVIPYYTRAAATGERRAQGEEPPAAGRVRRVAFFGRLEERKGIAPFVEALNRLEPQLLEGVELAFVGKATGTWPPTRIEKLLADRSREAVRVIAFSTDLDQHEAIDSLRRPGTLAVLPSYGETFGNAARECLENGIPFLAADTGAVPELVAREDWERTLFSPTASGIEDALRRRLTSEQPLAPARPGLDDTSLDALWADVLTRSAGPRVQPADRPQVDVVVVHRGSEPGLARCLAALSRQTHPRFRVLVADASGNPASPPLPNVSYEVVLSRAPERDVAWARREALGSSEADWTVFLDEQDVPSASLLETLLRAQAASGADVVSCGVEIESEGDRVLHLFVGEPGGLGVLSNGYGTVALIRRALFPLEAPSWRAPRDPDWPLLAGLSASGARIVSVPSPLVTRSSGPGRLEDDGVGAFLALQQLERAVPRPLEGVARIAGGLAASAGTPGHASDGQIPDLARRLRRKLRSWGARR